MFQNNHNDMIHWSGSTKDESGLAVPNEVRKKLEALE